MFDFFAGIPLVISMVAPFAVYKSLTDIFHYLADKNSNDFKSGLSKKMENESLVHCLEYCINHLRSTQEKEEDNNILDLWYMIGVQGPGILSHDLEYLYKLTFEEKEGEKET